MKVLIAIDERIFGQAISDFVHVYDWQKDTKFQIIHVVEPLSPMERMSLTKRNLETLEKERLRSGRALVHEIGSRLLEKNPEAEIHEIIFEHRTAKETILNIVSDWQPDLVVMGSHSRRGLDRLMLGSVSEAVMSQAPCSVAIIRVPDVKTTTEESKPGGAEVSPAKNEEVVHEERAQYGSDTRVGRNTRSAMF